MAPPDAPAIDVLTDCRILPIKRSGGGRRFRSTRDSLSDGATEEFADWIIPGPRTCEWCLEEQMHGSLEASASVAKYRTDLMAKVRAGDLQASLDHPLMMMLEFLYELVDRMLSFDQLQLPNLASAELIFRKIQQIKSAQAMSAVRPELDNELHFLGPALAVGRSPQVAPELGRFIADRIKEDNKLKVEHGFVKRHKY